MTLSNNRLQRTALAPPLNRSVMPSERSRVSKKRVADIDLLELHSDVR